MNLLADLPFREQLWLVIVDKGILAVTLAVIGFFFSKKLERIRRNEEEILDLKKQKTALENALFQDKRERKLKALDAQLTEFYYPIYYRLQKDDAIWRLSPQLSKKEGALPTEANDIIERNYLLKNHQEIVNIIETKSHLIEPDKNLQEQIGEYIKHVAVYNTIRNVDSLKSLNPWDFGSQYPKNFKTLIESKINKLQAEHDKLLNEIS